MSRVFLFLQLKMHNTLPLNPAAPLVAFANQGCQCFDIECLPDKIKAVRADNADSEQQEPIDLKLEFQTQVLALMDNLYRFALRMTRDPCEAEEIVADAIAKAWSAIDTLKDKKAFKSWIFQILVNTHRNNIRKKGREISFSETQEEEDEFWIFEQMTQPVLLWYSNPEQEFLNSVLREDLQRAVDDLPDIYRLVVGLVLVEGCSYDEASEILCVPVGTIRSRVNRGRSLLQKNLWRHAKEAGFESIDEASKGRTEKI